MRENTLDILAIGAHPDDVEISAAGTLLKSVEKGHSVAIVDLTGGELGTRGNSETRKAEAQEAQKLMKLVSRTNLGFADGFFTNDERSVLKVIEMIRLYRPKIVIANAPSDRHPDHGRASKLVYDACFYSGLNKIESVFDGKRQEAYRPSSLYYYIQDYYHKPDLVIDITEFWQKKLDVLRCFRSQFYEPSSKEPETPISGENFFEFLRSRAMDLGRPAGYRYAEGFIASRTIGVRDLLDLQ